MPGGWVGHASNSWFWPRSWCQGHGIEPHMGLCAQHGIRWRFSLSLCLCPTPHLHSEQRNEQNLMKKRIKSPYFYNGHIVIAGFLTATLAAHVILHLLWTSTSAGHDSFSGGGTQPFIPEFSGLPVDLPELGSCRFSWTFIPGLSGSKEYLVLQTCLPFPPRWINSLIFLHSQDH